MNPYTTQPELQVRMTVDIYTDGANDGLNFYQSVTTHPPAADQTIPQWPVSSVPLHAIPPAMDVSRMIPWHSKSESAAGSGPEKQSQRSCPDKQRGSSSSLSSRQSATESVRALRSKNLAKSQFPSVVLDDDIPSQPKTDISSEEPNTSNEENNLDTSVEHPIPKPRSFATTFPSYAQAKISEIKEEVALPDVTPQDVLINTFEEESEDDRHCGKPYLGVDSCRHNWIQSSPEPTKDGNPGDLGARRGRGQLRGFSTSVTSTLEKNELRSDLQSGSHTLESVKMTEMRTRNVMLTPDPVHGPRKEQRPSRVSFDSAEPQSFFISSSSETTFGNESEDSFSQRPDHDVEKHHDKERNSASELVLPMHPLYRKPNPNSMETLIDDIPLPYNTIVQPTPALQSFDDKRLSEARQSWPSIELQVPQLLHHDRPTEEDSERTSMLSSASGKGIQLLREPSASSDSTETESSNRTPTPPPQFTEPTVVFQKSEDLENEPRKETMSSAGEVAAGNQQMSYADFVVQHKLMPSSKIFEMYTKRRPGSTSSGSPLDVSKSSNLAPTPPPPSTNPAEKTEDSYDSIDEEGSSVSGAGRKRGTFTIRDLKEAEEERLSDYGLGKMSLYMGYGPGTRDSLTASTYSKSTTDSARPASRKAARQTAIQEHQQHSNLAEDDLSEYLQGRITPATHGIETYKSDSTLSRDSIISETSFRADRAHEFFRQNSPASTDSKKQGESKAETRSFADIMKGNPAFAKDEQAKVGEWNERPATVLDYGSWTSVSSYGSLRQETVRAAPVLTRTPPQPASRGLYGEARIGMAQVGSDHNRTVHPLTQRVQSQDSAGSRKPAAPTSV